MVFDRVLDGTGNPQRQVQLRCHGLSGAPNLSFERQPAGIADRSRSGHFRIQGLGQVLGQGQLVLVLDAASDRDDPRRLREVHRLLRLTEGRFRLLTDGRRIDGDPRGGNGRGGGAANHAVTLERTGLDGDDEGTVSLGQDIGGQLPLEDEPCERRLPRVVGDADHVGHERHAEPGRKLRHEVTRLVGVRAQHEPRLGLFDQLGQRLDVAVGRIAGQRGIVHGADVDYIGCRQLGGEGIEPCPEEGHRHGEPAGLRLQLLRGSHGFPARPVQLAFTLFGNNEDHRCRNS
jgi:hypothetical protein